MHENVDVLIEGAGLAGLACAITLNKQNISFKVVEASSSVGGRIKTEKLNGFTLDHGFQILLTSYPELKNFINLSELDLCYFNSGAKIYQPSGSFILANPSQHLGVSLSSTLWSGVSVKDKSLVLKLLLKCMTNNFNAEELRQISTKNFLIDFGFSLDFIELFWKPFFKGIYLDNELSYDSAYFMFLMKNFAFGKTAIPKLGMQQLPIVMSKSIEADKFIFNETVKHDQSGIGKLISGKLINYKYRVSAFNADSDLNSYNKTTTYYFHTKIVLEDEKWLYVIPTNLGFNINNLVVLSNINKEYCSEDGSLISVSVVNDKAINIDIIIEEIKQVLSNPNLDLNFIKSFQIKKALPAKHHNGLKDFQQNNTHFLAGDYMCTPSINGALESGRIVAEQIIKRMYEQST